MLAISIERIANSQTGRDAFLRLRQIGTVLLVALLVVQPAMADTVRLLSGEAHVGTVENQDAILRSPLSHEFISILLKESTLVIQVPQSEIDYIILDRSGRPQVVDIAAMLGKTERPELPSHEPEQPHAGQEIWTSENRGGSGVPLIIAGAAMALVGVVFKFGTTKDTMGPIELTTEGSHYNGLNYALMAVGGGLVVGGVWKESKRKASALSSLDNPPNGGHQAMLGAPVVAVKFGF